MKKILKWYKLDYSASYYPILMTKNTQSIFRLSAVLKEKVDPAVLQSALCDIMPRFPSFSVRLRSGFFWYYFEENTKPLKVFEDDGILLSNIAVKKTKGYLFRVTYFERKVSLDIFHGITDGIGAMEFFKALIARYLEKTGAQTGKDNIKDITEPPKPEELEDSFIKAYKPTKLKDINLKKIAGKPPLIIKGSRFKGQGYGTISGLMSLSEIKQKAKEAEAGITAFLCAHLAKAIIDTQKGERKPVSIMVPVNLRPHFGSETLKNFVLFVRLSVNADKNLNIGDIIKSFDKQLKAETAKEKLQEQINTTVKGSSLFVFKALPLPLKHFFIRFGKLFYKSRQSMIFSNLGNVKLPSGAEESVDRLLFNLNVSKHAPCNASAISFNDKLVISFTRAIKETEVERGFFTSLAKQGINIKVSSNFREEQHVL